MFGGKKCNGQAGGRRHRRTLKPKTSRRVKHHRSTRKGMRRKTARRAYMK